MANLGQILVMGVPGTTLDAETRAQIKAIQPGGFILFGRNIESPMQVRKLVDDLRESVNIEPIVTIDQEGGRVARLRLIGTEPPSARQLREKILTGGGNSSLISWHGKSTAQILRLFGFNLNLCPVLDIAFDEEADNSLKNRCWGQSAGEVMEWASIFNSSMRSEGILSCGKHFPGYSAAPFDPHHVLPEVKRSRQDLEDNEWRPFKKLLPELDTIMVGHARYYDLDPSGCCSSLSKAIVDGVIRKEWNFDGCIITDDMDMGAIINEYGFQESIQMAANAGNDLILICHRVSMVEEALLALHKMPGVQIEASLKRIGQLKKKLQRPYPFSLEAFQKADGDIASLRGAVLGAERIHEKSVEDAKRSPVETF